MLNIDVDKILGLKGSSEVKSVFSWQFLYYFIQVRDAVSSVASEFEFNQKTVEEIKKEAADIL